MGGLAVFSGLRVGGGVFPGWTEHVSVFDRYFAFRFVAEHGLLLGLSGRNHPTRTDLSYGHYLSPYRVFHCRLLAHSDLHEAERH